MDDFEFFIKLKSKLSEVNLNSGYNDIINSFNFDVILDESDSGYSGDTFVLVKTSNYYGFLKFGWGSCSYCDALQGCHSDEDVTALRDSIFNSIIWKESIQAIQEYLKSDSIHWYDSSGAYLNFKEKALNLA